MHSVPGRLTGGGIRTLPEERRAAILRTLKLQEGRGFRIKSIRYRITGFRDPMGHWVSRDPKNGHYYRFRVKGSGERPGRHRSRVKPTPAMMARSPLVSLEIEVDRGKGARIYYISSGS